jgi:hypothetical protein
MPTSGPVHTVNGPFYNPQGSTITGTAYGVKFTGAGSALNDGAVYANYGSALNGDAFYMAGASFVTNASTGIISGSKDGVYIGAAGHIYNSGALSGGVDGALITGVAYVYNDPGAKFSGNIDGLKVTGAGNVTNQGSFAASQGVGVSITGAGLVNNEQSGAISAAYFGIDINSAGTVFNAGLITALQGTGVKIGAASVLFNEAGGSISGSLYGVDMVTGTSTVENAGIITGSSGLNGGAVVIGAAGGILLVDEGAVFQGNVKDSGGSGIIHLQVDPAAGVLEMGSSFSGFSEIIFDTGSTWTLKGDIADLASSQAINGFGAGDTIDLEGFTKLSDQYVAGTGLEISNGITTEILGITGAFSTRDFGVTNLANGDVQVVYICYLRGTRLATQWGEVAIEDLRIGDLLLTRGQGLRPIKWIGRQSFDSRFIRANREQIPVCIAAGALGVNQPVRDLWVSPGHSMLLGDVLVLAKTLVNGVTITQDDMPGEVHYYQIEFETHDCVLAEGAWSESFADCGELRGRFHNAAEFGLLYPDAVMVHELSLCAPRPEAGAALEAALRPVAAHALSLAIPGPLRGWIDAVAEDGQIRGWAQDTGNAQLPVLLEILRDGQVVGSVLACEYRGDLEQAGIGNGRHSFEFTLPGADTIQVRRACDGAELPRSYACLDALALRRA